MGTVLNKVQWVIKTPAVKSDSFTRVNPLNDGPETLNSNSGSSSYLDRDISKQPARLKSVSFWCRVAFF